MRDAPRRQQGRRNEFSGVARFYYQNTVEIINRAFAGRENTVSRRHTQTMVEEDFHVTGTIRILHAVCSSFRAVHAAEPDTT
jgi:hypothetical protein